MTRRITNSLLYGVLKRARPRAPRADRAGLLVRCARAGAALMALVLLTAAPTSMAARVEGLYDVEVVVASRSSQDRRIAAGDALGEVLVRVTGLRHVPRIRAVREAINAPERFYVQYAYSTRVIAPPVLGDAPVLGDKGGAADATGREEFVTRPEAPKEETLLAVRFDPASILELVRRAGLPLWGADRPRVLAWIAAPPAGRHDGRHEMVAAAGSRFSEAVRRDARERGIPITLPLMDVDDNMISTVDVRGRFWLPLQRASVRYRPNMVLAAWVSEADGSWRAEWELRAFNAGTSVPKNALPITQGAVEGRGEGVEEALGRVVDSVTDELMQRLAVLNRGEDTVRLRVVGIRSPQDYADLLRFLESREYMERLEVRMLVPGTVHLLLHSRSTTRQLENLLTIGGMLVPDADDGIARDGSGTATRETAISGTAISGTAIRETVQDAAAPGGAALSDIALRWSGP